MKVLLVAYACRPNFGSEPKNGWQWAARLSASHEITVLTHPRGQEAIESEIEAAGLTGLRVQYVELPRLLDPWRGNDSESCVRLRDRKSVCRERVSYSV